MVILICESLFVIYIKLIIYGFIEAAVEVPKVQRATNGPRMYDLNPVVEFTHVSSFCTLRVVEIQKHVLSSLFCEC